MKKYIEKYKHIFAPLLIVLISCVCFAWVGYDTLKESIGLGHREIINDDYSVLTQSITDQNGVKQPFTVKANTDFYGVNINMHTYNRVCFGTVYVDLLDEEGNVLASSSDDLTAVKDNTFKRFIFGGKNFKSETDENYVLHIYLNPQSSEDKIALWKSETTAENFDTITENGSLQEGTIALQYITKYVTEGMRWYYIGLCGLFLVFLIAVYFALFIKKAKIEYVFLIFALIFGFIFAVYTPQRGSADEYVHIASSYYNSNTVLGIKDSFYGNTLWVRKCDGVNLNRPVDYTAFDLQETYEGLFKMNEYGDEYTTIKATAAQVFPPLYWAQTIGITLARILNLGYVQMLVMGRLANLLLYVCVVFFAIKIMPVYKNILTVIALTPIPLQIAASFTYDTFVIAFSFLFTAKVFQLAYEKQNITAKDIVFLTVTGGLLAPAKTVYVLLIGLIFIIPKAKFKTKKQMYTAFGAVICCAVIMWFANNLNSFKILTADNTAQSNAETVSAQTLPQTENTASSNTEITQENTSISQTENDGEDTAQQYDIYSDIGENGDNRNYFTVGYILTHIPQTIKLVAKTIQENTVLYVQQLFGGVLGEVIISPVKINWLYTIAGMFIVFLSCVREEREEIFHKGIRKWWALAIFTAVTALFVFACITWTPINYTTIFGIQGRYFIPVLPLAVFFFVNENIRIKKDITPYLIFALACVNVLILLDGFTIMATNTKIL